MRTVYYQGRFGTVEGAASFYLRAFMSSCVAELTQDQRQRSVSYQRWRQAMWDKVAKMARVEGFAPTYTQHGHLQPSFLPHIPGDRACGIQQGLQLCLGKPSLQAPLV